MMNFTEYYFDYGSISTTVEMDEDDSLELVYEYYGQTTYEDYYGEE